MHDYLTDYTMFAYALHGLGALVGPDQAHGPSVAGKIQTPDLPGAALQEELMDVGPRFHD